MSLGAKIIKGLEEAARGEFSRVNIEGQVWERTDIVHVDEVAINIAALMDKYEITVPSSPKFWSELTDILRGKSNE